VQKPTLGRFSHVKKFKNKQSKETNTVNNPWYKIKATIGEPLEKSTSILEFKDSSKVMCKGINHRK
jgi:hypothetical protein